MTDPNPAADCRCLGPVAALHHALADTPPPECPTHLAGTAGPALALNDNTALGARLLGDLTATEEGN